MPATDLPPTRVRSAKSKPLNPLARAFLRGLLIVVPAAVTVWLVVTVVQWADGLIDTERMFGRSVPGLGFVLVLAGIAVLGFLGGNVLARYLLEGLEALFTRTPLVRLVYTSLRDLIDAFVGEKKRFDQPVLVSPYGEGGALVPGFVTRSDLGVFELDEHVAVYLPQAYNFAGQVIVVPRDQVRALGTDSTAVMAFIVSGGVSGAGAEED